MDTPVVNGSGPLDTRRPPNPVELHRVAKFFDDLAQQIRDEAVRDAELTGRSPMALSSYWQAAVRLLCQAVEAGAQLEWWPEARQFERVESDLMSPETSFSAKRIGGFLRFGPNEVLSAAWLHVVTLLLAKYGRYFGGRNVELYLLPDDKIAKWEGVGKIHAEVHTRACQLLAELLRGEADEAEARPDGMGKPRLTHADRKERERKVSECIRKRREQDVPIERITRDGIAAATGIPSGAVSATKAWSALSAEKKRARLPAPPQQSQTPLDKLVVREEAESIDDAIEQHDWDAVLKAQKREQRLRR